MQTRKVGPFDVSAIGFGCMGLSSGYGPPTPRDRAERVLLGALDAGYTFFDTAAVYGTGHNETLVAEVLGASSVGLYALCLARRLPASVTAVARSGTGRVPAGTHVHVLVPCYQEALTIVAETVWAAAEADLPPGATSTVWLLDDGKDASKKEWVASLACPRIRYLSGRARPAGEMNGKSGNLNNVCRQLYPAGVAIPGSELVCVFDADQVATSEFFTRTLPLFDGGDDVAMVLSPQVS